jgi:vacuolar-type H+-ATPase subunit B/Vma2
LEFADRFEREFVGQSGQRRSIADTFAAGWTLLESVPRADLHRLSERTWAAHEAEGRT